MTLEKQLLMLPINAGGVIRPFANNLESIVLQSEILFTSGKQSRQLLTFQSPAPVLPTHQIQTKWFSSIILTLCTSLSMIQLIKQIEKVQWDLKRKEIV